MSKRISELLIYNNKNIIIEVKIKLWSLIITILHIYTTPCILHIYGELIIRLWQLVYEKTNYLRIWQRQIGVGVIGSTPFTLLQ